MTQGQPQSSKAETKEKNSGKLFVVIFNSAIVALDLCLLNKDSIYFPIWNLN